MSTTRFTSRLVAAIAILVAISAVQAQDYQPFIEPGYFNHDLQFFAPATDIDTYGGPVQRTGWFGEYARMYLGVSRPDYVESSSKADMTWAHRLDLGYMIDDVNHDHGWLFSTMTMYGPGEGDVIRVQRLNRFNDQDDGMPDPTTGTGTGTGGGTTATTLVEPASDRNNQGPPNRLRFYDVTQSVNMGDLRSYELNKLFRMEPLNDGGILEPFFGFRYMRFRDRYINQDYIMYSDDGVQSRLPPLPPSTLPVAVTDLTVEDLFNDQYMFTNNMVGGQVGLRWLKRVSRWNFNTEFRFFGFQNFQNLSRHYAVERTYYDGGGSGSQVTKIVNAELAREDSHRSETVFGTDIRAEVQYELYRDFSLMAGVQVLGMYRGVGRGIDLNYSQDLIMVGSTFGFVVNR